jgi:spermidine/putrescine ABC transporter ATP-binding subunit
VLNQVSKQFGAVAALHPTSLEVAPGALLSLLGPSGCGKTTTLRIIAGFETPDGGSVRVGERDITGLAPHRRGLGMVFQGYSLFPHMTVAANVAFGLRMARVDGSRIDRRVQEMLELVRLPGYGGRYPNQLSGGQQQRVAVARALITEPGVLLLDEPLGALDRGLREEMQFHLRQIQRFVGITTVMVTHDQEEALTMSDRVAVMDRGRIMQIGTPDEVYNRPVNRFVSGFVGASNTFRGWRSGGGIVVRDAGVGALETGIMAPGASLEVDLVVRPESLFLSRPGASGGQDTVSLAGTVRSHVFRGTSHVYEVAVAGRETPLIVFQYPERGGAGVESFEPGSDVMVSWSKAKTIVLEAEVS